MDHFNVVRLAGDAVDRWRRRVQQETRSHRGRTGDSLYAARRTLHTGADLLTDRQRLAALFDADEHVEVQAPCGISYQRAIIAYREPDRPRGRRLTTARIESLSRGVPAALAELIALGADPDQARHRRSGSLRPTRHIQRSDQGDQQPPGTPARTGPRGESPGVV